MEDDDASLGRIAEAIIAIRRMRDSEFPPELFDEHAWDLLLYLFAAHARGERLDEDMLARSIGRSVSVCQRWAAHLRQSGQIVVEGDHVVLASDGLAAMRRFLVRTRDMGLAAVG